MRPLHVSKHNITPRSHLVLSGHPPRPQVTSHINSFTTLTHNTAQRRLHCNRRTASTYTLFASLRTHSTAPLRPYRPPQTRLLSTTTHNHAAPPSPPSNEPTPLSTDEYHKISDAYIDTLVAQLEAMQEEREDVDVEYSVRPLIPFSPLLQPPSCPN